MRVSIAIPCYEMNGHGVEALNYSLNKLYIQTFKDFEVVITDHSINDDIKNLCEFWQDKLDIKYYKTENGRGSPTVNTNNGLSKCSGEIIKLLCQDDYLYDEYSLEKTHNAFDENVNWLASSYVHTQDKKTYYKHHIPSMNDNIETVNTIGTPSCVAIRNNNIMYFDENLKWAYDCEYYRRLYNTFGNPKILNEITMINYIHGNSTTNTIATNELRNREENYIKVKHGKN